LRLRFCVSERRQDCAAQGLTRSTEDRGGPIVDLANAAALIGDDYQQRRGVAIESKFDGLTPNSLYPIRVAH
jgi:hypothetical protein